MSNRTVYELFSVEGRKALVTGGSAGMGRAMAEVLVEGGAQVAIVGRSGRVFDVACGQRRTLLALSASQ